MNKCHKCYKILTEEELVYFKENELNKYGNDFLCTRCWCQCMPEALPWSYLTDCVRCNRTICKACKNVGGSGLFCNYCINK